MLTIVVIFALGVYRSFVLTDGDVLAVRNGFRTHRLHRDQIDGFERQKLGPDASNVRVAYIEARTHSGKNLPLLATVGHHWYPPTEDRHDKQTNTLLDWKHGPVDRCESR